MFAGIWQALRELAPYGVGAVVLVTVARLRSPATVRWHATSSLRRGARGRLLAAPAQYEVIAP
jgi:hypothetical protein